MIESYLHRYLGSYVDNVDTFIVPSRFYQKKLVEWGFDARGFEYVPNFVDVESLSRALSPDALRLLRPSVAPRRGSER